MEIDGTSEQGGLGRMTAVVLAGGTSSRMGLDKSFLLVDGQILIQRIVSKLTPFFAEVLIGADDVGKFDFLKLRVVPDEKPGEGPLMGLVSCLAASASELNFVIACDIPEVNMGFVRTLAREAEGFDAVVPRPSGGQSEPLFAVYRKSAVEPGRACLSRGRRRIVDLLAEVRVRFVSMPANDWFRNLNTWEDYLEAMQAITERKRAGG
jgi:molybdenum cofactor guanylyltransferase